MRASKLCGFIALISRLVVADQSPRDYDTHDYYALHLEPSTSPLEVATSLGLRYEGPLGELPDHHVFYCGRQQGDVVKDARRELRKRKEARAEEYHILDRVLFSQKQKPKPRMHKRLFIPSLAERMGIAHGVGGPMPLEVTPVDSSVAKQKEIARSLDIQDPIFSEQWHLFNPIQVGHDVNVSGVWSQGVTGQGAIVAIVDDGLDMDSEDLKDNYFAEGSFDFNDHGPEPRPRLSDDRHGTRCAGEIAAVKNTVCGVGVAWDAKVAGIRILSKEIGDADEAVALNYGFNKTQIYSCSWGPPDNGEAMDAPGVLIRRAMINGVQNGRGGKGSVFVFASGNGAANDDNCNFDGYTNSIYSITVGAIDRKGLHPYYSEPCSATLVVTYSSGSGSSISTTDVGKNQCYSHHGGTSAAAPLAAGIFALVLSVRPDLSWRDLQYLALETAIPVNEETDGEWQPTTIGKKFSHKYGYGKVDAYAIVEAARTFKSVKPQAWYNSPWMHVKQSIPEGSHGLASTVEITQEQLKDANLERLEHVTVTMNVAHERRGDVSVELQSPNGIISHISTSRRNDKSKEGYVDWTFMTVVHWGESGIGNWTVIVKDTMVNEFHGNFTDWKITLWGECIDEAKATPLPMPNEEDDDNHDATETVSASTTSITSGGQPTASVTGNPTDHPTRPVNMKPTSGSGPSDSQTALTPTSTSSDAAASPSASSKPNIFGVSKWTRIWIYGSSAIIVLFCAGIGTYLYLARRKRLRNSVRDDYEFEVLDDQEDEFGVRRAGAGAGRKRKGARRRGGELYDAFAAESEEELFSGDEEKYRDGDGEEDEDDERRGLQEGEKSSGGRG
ncbi:MAG: pheromone processing endoprotease [Peltula sp. TS41687]|nr:MAG: pheromone processing endoprotease [Peltula sp. TS41687]